MAHKLTDALQAATHAARLVLDDAVRVDPRWLVVGVLLYVLSQSVRTLGWHTIIKAAYPASDRLRRRDTICAYLAGAGCNSVIPARGGDVVKLALVRRRIEGSNFATLAGTFLPETLFETVFGTGLVLWALAHGWLPIPTTSGELPSVDISMIMRNPGASALTVAALLATAVLLRRMYRRRSTDLLRRVRGGLAILRTPRLFVTGVASWQALARVVRLAALAAFMHAFGLPVTPTTAVLVMAAQGGGRIVPIAPASAGLRMAMLSYGFAEVSAQSVSVAQLTAFTFGVSAVMLAAGLLLTAVILLREVGTVDLRAARRLLDQDRRADRHARVKIDDIGDVHPQAAV